MNIYKNYVYIASVALFFLVQSVFVLAAEKQEQKPTDGSKHTDGLQIMTAVSERDRGKDYVMSTSWVLTKKGRVTNRMRYTEMRKNYSGKNGLIYKSIVRYTFPPNIGRRAFLVWNYKGRQKTFWYYLDNMTVGQRTTNVDFLTPPAESDFSLMDYIDVNLEEESHKVLHSEMYKDSMCHVVESTPLNKDIKYGKRVSWIDQENLIPLKIDYFDKSSKLWKTLRITWQNKDGLWFWKKAEVENTQSDYKTLVVIEDLQVNVGLHDREFTRVALGRKKF